MDNKYENQKEFVRQVIDLLKGDEEYSHMTGDITLCGVTADIALRQIKEDEKKEGK